MIHLHTLGDTLITVGEKEVRPTSPMVFAALLYLGVERGRRVPRAALQELLFSNSDERSGAHSLRQLLYKLRQLGAPIDAKGTHILVAAEAVMDDCSTDYWRSSNGAIPLERFTAGFAPDYAPRISERFDAWLEQHRMAVAADARRQLATILAAKRSAADWSATERCARALLAVDPLNEEATLALAEAAAMTGAKARALEILSRYQEETGTSDLQLSPSLLKQRIGDNITSSSGERANQLVGRASELAEILAGIRRCQRSGPSIIVISGEAGIGKTRILEESIAVASLGGIRSNVVRCRPHYVDRPLSVFIELVPALLASRGALGASPDSLRQMKALVSHADDLNELSTDVGDDTARSELLRRSIHDLVGAIAAEQPLILAVEDVHWADDSSLRELLVLAEDEGLQLAVILTTRAVDKLRRSTRLGEHAVLHRLKPLAHAALVDLSVVLLRDRNTTETRDWCVKLAAGNPLFLRMLCAHVAGTGVLQVPTDLVSVIGNRLRLLSHGALRTLQFASLLGPHCTIESLRSLLESSHFELLSHLTELDDEGYLVASEGRVSLAHELVADAVVSMAAPVSRRALHASVAFFLERRFESTQDSAVLWDCAEHWRASGELNKSLELLRRCASHALRIGRAQEAMELLNRALTSTKANADRIAVLGDLMVAAKATGQIGDVYKFAVELRSLVASVHDQLELFEMEARWYVEQKAQTIELLECARSELATIQHRTQACLLLLRFAHETCADLLAREAFAAVEPILDSAPARERLAVLVVFHTTFGDKQAALRYIGELRDLLPLMPAVTDRLEEARKLVVGLSILGYAHEAISIAQQFERVAKDLGLRTRQREFCELLAGVYIDKEDLEAAELWFKNAAEAKEPTASVHYSIGLELALGRRNAKAALEMLHGLAQIKTRSLRVRAHYVSSEARIRMLDPSYRCDDHTLQQLREFYELTKRSFCEEVAQAYLHALMNRGETSRAYEVLEDYLVARREVVARPSITALHHQLAARHGKGATP